MEASDLTEAAPRVFAPTLVLHGEMDELVSKEQAVALADALPGGEFARYQTSPGLPVEWVRNGRSIVG